MATPLKDLFSKDFVNIISDALKNELNNKFNPEQFCAKIFDTNWEKKELKERMRHISTELSSVLNQNYKISIKQILNIVRFIKLKNRGHGFEYMIFPDFIEQNGIEYYQESIEAIEEITQFISCEFAIRPFIIKYKKKCLIQMLTWSKHKNEHVRRLASEGCRSRLPWSIALPTLKKDPTPILPILENLKHDPSEYVRRSVANNLNDISKDNPQILLKIAKQWLGQSAPTNKLVKHACRTLLKQGNTKALALFGYSDSKNYNVRNFTLKSSTIKVGEILNFEFSLLNNSNQKEKLRIEYAIYFLLKNNSYSKKVFKLTEKEYHAKSNNLISKNHSFRKITTRKYYSGLHKIELIINGIAIDTKDFKLKT